MFSQPPMRLELLSAQDKRRTQGYAASGAYH